MTVSEVVRPGDKVDISLLQHMERLRNDGTIPRLYKSKVLDIKENGNIEVAMPTEGGRLVLLPLNVRLELVFYARGGLYRIIGQITERFKQENMYILEIEVKSQIEKFQRREFFRYPCIIDFNYYTITREEADMGTGEAIFVYLNEEKEEEGKKRQEKDGREYVGQIMDLSGGGARFISDEKLKEEQYLLFELHLKNESVNKTYYIVARVISCKITDNRRYETRTKFLIDDNNTREEIIRFIFEEERKARQRSRE